MKIAVDTANFAGFIHAGMPVIVRGSTARPTTANTNAASISTLAPVSGASAFHNRLIRSRVAFVIDCSPFKPMLTTSTSRK